MEPALSAVDINSKMLHWRKLTSPFPVGISADSFLCSFLLLCAGSFSGWNLPGPCGCCHSLWVHMRVTPALSRRHLPMTLPLPVALTVFPTLLFQRSLSLERKGLIKITHLGLSGSKVSHSLHISINYCPTQEAASLLCGYSGVSLVIILLLCFL